VNMCEDIYTVLVSRLWIFLSKMLFCTNLTQPGPNCAYQGLSGPSGLKCGRSVLGQLGHCSVMADLLLSGWNCVSMVEDLLSPMYHS